MKFSLIILAIRTGRINIIKLCIRNIFSAPNTVILKEKEIYNQKPCIAFARMG